MDEELRRYREGVEKAIQAAWAAGVPAFQARDGYLVALYPDGRIVKLKKLEGPFAHAAENAETVTSTPRRAQRGR
jgi:hypothetical protein